MSNRAVMWGIINFEKKNKKSLASFPLQIRYCRTYNINSPLCFTSKLRKKGKDKENKKKLSLIRKKKGISPGFELMTSGFRGQRSNHFAVEDSRFGKSIFPIYRQSIFIINFNTDKTGSGSSRNSVCLTT